MKIKALKFGLIMAFALTGINHEVFGEDNCSNENKKCEKHECGSGSTCCKKLPVYLDVNAPIESRVEDALSRMTLEEKVALCHAQSKFSSAGVPRLGIPEIWHSDGPHGVREEIEWDTWNSAGWTNDSCTAFPALISLAATFNPRMSFIYGMALGEEARYRNKTIMLGPGVNIYRTPLNGRNFEYMGEDPYLASKLVVPYIIGLQKNKVAACVKHFALNNQETWRGHINVNVSERALNEIYLPAFKAAVQEGGTWSIMGAYNKYRGQHCCHNEYLLNDILKKDWGFDGVVVSDWGGTHDAKEAALNGLDIEMGTFTNGTTITSRAFAYDDYYLGSMFLKSLKSGEIPMSVIDDKARRILRLSFRTNMAANRPFGKFVSEEHSKAARQIASEAIVLLKNDKGFLPIVKGKYGKIAVIGENAVKGLVAGGGAAGLKSDYEISPLEGLQAVYGKENIVYSMGYASGRSFYGRTEPSGKNTAALFKDAVETAKNADMVIFIGGLNRNHQQDSEAGDRTSLNLPFGQDKLLETILSVNKNVTVVILSGNAVAMPWIDKVQSVLQCWYLGSEAGNAIADVISGAVNPSGKLPISFPKRLEDCGAHSFDKLSYPGDSINQYYKEDILVGYRWLDTKKIVPLFPFGHGLSYTTFSYGKVSTDKKTYAPQDTIKVSFTLQNTGKVDGAEAVQVYVSKKKSVVARAAKDLKAFDKIYLKSGETKTVNLEIKASDLSYFDEKNHCWALEQGEYLIQNASSSRVLISDAKIIIKE
jgi:beta-glucosidase